MEILVAIAGKLAEYTVEPIGRQVGYLAHYKTNYQNLQTKLEDLGAARDEVQHKADQVQRRGKRIETTVLNWKRRVDAIITETEDFLKDGRHVQTECLHGFCSHPVLHYQLSKKSIKLVEEIDKLYGKREFPNFEYDGPLQDPCLISPGDYCKFDSRNSIMRRIMNALGNPETEMVLVCGIGGVGKTTLVEEVLRQAMHENLFDDVVMVRDVKQNPDLVKIQKEIATKLGLSIVENDTLAERAPKLCDRIKDKRILVALDDVSEEIDLLPIGLPRSSPLVNCKVLLTSRIRKNLSLDMRPQEDIPLDVLNEDEAWILFEKMAGDVVKDSRIRSVAIEVAKKCGRLPILIVTVARAMKDRNTLSAWRDTRRRLGGFDKKELKEKAYLALQWSYNQLEEKELKPLFLLCGIIVVQNHIYLADLLKYSFGLGLIKNVDTIEEARDALDALVENLKDSCLLLESDKKRHIRMHDLVCEIAVWIASKEQHVLSVEYGGELKEWPDKHFFERCSKMSLQSSNIPMLSQLPAGKYQKLEMFYFLNSKAIQSVKIPFYYFSKMEELKVLDLTQVHMLSLPSSLEFLKNLKTLCLEACLLEGVGLVGHLTNLEILSFAQSDIKLLPKEVGQLIRLRWLDLSDCWKLEVISPGVISRLKSLEELTMRNVKHFKWEAERGGSNASLLELKDLSELTALEIHIPDANVLPSNLFSSNKLVRYQIYIGDVWNSEFFFGKTMSETNLNTLKLKLTTSNELDQGVITLLKRCEDLSLDGTESVNGILRQLHVEDFQQLINLRLQENVDFTYIINRKVVFPQLTTLKVDRCHHLKFLFSISMAKSLVELKHLKVIRCKIMEEIISTEDQSNRENINIMFSKLETLKLSKLPNLVRFCTENCIDLSPMNKLNTEVGASIFDPPPTSSKNPDVRTCLFDARVKFPSLEKLDLRKLGKLKTIWNNKLADQDSFHRLREVNVHICPSLMNMFVPRMMGRLNALETLYIGGCGSLEAVFEEGESDVADTSSSSSSPQDYCQNLGSVYINSCESLRKIFTASVARGLQKLQSLDVLYCEKVEEIISGEEGLETEPSLFVFPKVTRIKFYNMPKLGRFYPGVHVSKWPSLKSLSVYECKTIKVLAVEVPEKHEQPQPGGIKQSLFLIQKDSFPKLEELSMDFLEIWYGPSSPALVFSTLKSISFDGRSPFSKQATKDFLHKLPKLAELEVKCNSVEILFVNQEMNDGEEIHPVGTLSGVKTLKINHMNKLLQIGNGNSETAGPVLPNLDFLHVYCCRILKSLESSAISFRYLTSLMVSDCEGLEYLTSYNVAKNLMQLTRLEVKCCAVLREIVRVSNEDDHDTCEIAFSRLQLLKLHGLLKLLGFCLGNCTVKLPSSSELEVNYCPIEAVVDNPTELLSIIFFQVRLIDGIPRKQWLLEDLIDQLIKVQCITHQFITDYMNMYTLLIQLSNSVLLYLQLIDNDSNVHNLIYMFRRINQHPNP